MSFLWNWNVIHQKVLYVYVSNLLKWTYQMESYDWSQYKNILCELFDQYIYYESKFFDS